MNTYYFPSLEQNGHSVGHWVAKSATEPGQECDGTGVKTCYPASPRVVKFKWSLQQQLSYTCDTVCHCNYLSQY